MYLVALMINHISSYIPTPRCVICASPWPLSVELLWNLSTALVVYVRYTYIRGGFSLAKCVYVCVVSGRRERCRDNGERERERRRRRIDGMRYLYIK